MNAVNNLLDALGKNGIRLGVNVDGNLRIRGDKNHLNDSLIEDIRKHKEQLVAVLKASLPFALLSEKERGSLGEGYEDAYPMSALQTGMVFHTQLEGFSGIYHDIMGEHVKCPWNRSCFEAALAACIEQHPILRTGFRLDGERPLQMVHAAIELPLKVEDLRGQLASEQEQYLVGWMQERKLHVFDWEQGPLLHIDIFLRTEESFQYVISFHHAVLDGWSRAVLTTMLYNRYERLLRGQEVEAVQVDWTYRDFIAQEQQVLSDPAAKAYFMEMLEDAPTQQLPRVKGGGAERSQGRFVVEQFTPLARRLIELAMRLGMPVQSVLMAAHFKVLATMSGQSRAVSCVTHNGRPEAAGAERSLGLYLNSLPQALEVSRGSWRSLIRQVAEMNAASMQYRGYPLSKIQQDVGIFLGEVSFNYTHFHVYQDITTSSDQTLELLGSFGFEQTNFDLLVDVSRGMGDVMSLTMVYNEQAFAEGMIARLGQYYVKAFELMLAGLDEPHHGQSLLSDEEVRQLLAASNASSVAYWHDLCIHEQFARQARKTPEAVAVVFGEQTMSYRELNSKAERLARYLAEAGVGVESRVGIYLRRSQEMMIGILGVMKAGGTYVPLEPGLPKQRLEYMRADAAIEWVLVESGSIDSLPLSGVDVVMMDGAGTDPRWLEEMEDGLTPELAAKPKADNLVYILYTSGSTGKPKGVMVEHGGLSNYLAYAATYLAGEIEGSVVSSPLSFDATLTTLLAPLLVGRTVELLPDDEMMMGRLAERLFGATSGLLFKITPAHLEGLEYIERAVKVGGAAHMIVVGGEQLSAQVLRKWKSELLPQACFVNEYGPTEAVVGCSVWKLSDESGLKELEAMAAAPIGRPISNTQLYVLGEGGQLQPSNTVGELYIGGAGLARGYLNQETLTRERFIPNPFSEGAGSRLYKTGDLVRRSPGGELAFVGRRDDQVKIRGYRIELGEIEQQLGAMAGVSAAVVLAREDEGRKRLVAYVMPSEYPVEVEQQAALRPGLISGYREGLAASLPDYMVPSAFVILAEMPLTPNGKLDRKALPSPEGEDVQAALYVAPRNATEQAMCEVWQEVLGLDRIGIEDNFFSLGGDSILSIRIVSMLKGRGVSIDIKDIFQHQTIEQLAAQAMHHSDLTISKMSNNAADQRERLSHEGKDIEEGVF